jgi:chemotaxis protein MotB
MSARSQLLAGTMNPESVLQVVGMADRAPLDTKRVDAGVNRRIELLILTTAQAKSIAAMFGMPENSNMLIQDVDTALPDATLLQKLRSKLATRATARCAIRATKNKLFDVWKPSQPEAHV